MPLVQSPRAASRPGDGFSSSFVTWFAIVSAAAIVALIVRELVIAEPIVNLRLLNNRAFAISNVVMFFFGFIISATTQLLPQLTQDLVGYDATTAGLTLGLGGFATIVFMPIAATNDIIKIETDQLDRVRHQFDLGAITKSDVLSQQSTLAQTQANLPPLLKQRAQQRNQLMVYLGRLPSQDQGEAVDLERLRLPRRLPVNLPSSLVRQRPDIRAAEATVHQASATIGVAISNMLPDVSLTASAGSDSLSLNKLFASQSNVYSVAGSVTQKIFDGGNLYHTKEADVATYRQDVEKYRSTVLSSFQNVADSLRAIQADADTLKAQVAAEKVSRDSFKLSLSQLALGSVSYATIINAEQTYQNARIARVKAQATRFSDTVALYQSLGGGWWHRVDQTTQAQPRKRAGYFAGLEPGTSQAVGPQSGEKQ